jgi:hypothetical protein
MAIAMKLGNSLFTKERKIADLEKENEILKQKCDTLF